jgi:hypothetical protein
MARRNLKISIAPFNKIEAERQKLRFNSIRKESITQCYTGMVVYPNGFSSNYILGASFQAFSG